MKRTKTPWKSYGRYGSVGIELVASILLGYFGGRWLNDRLEQNGWITVVGFLVGAYAGFRVMFITAKRMQKEGAQADEEWLAAHPWERHRFDPNHLPPAEAPPEERPKEVAPDAKTRKDVGDDEHSDDDPRPKP